MKEYLQTTDAVLDKVGSSGTGLTGAEAAARLEKNGKNKLAEGKRESAILRFLKQLIEPMTIILLVAAAISAVLAIYEGSFPSDVVIIMAVVVINAVLGVVQESKAEEAIAALQEMSAATSKVLRDGKQVSVHSEDLVVGDVIILEAGDAVPADARLLECASMKVGCKNCREPDCGRKRGCTARRPHQYGFHGFHRRVRSRKSCHYGNRHGYRDGQDRLRTIAG